MNRIRIVCAVGIWCFLAGAGGIARAGEIYWTEQSLAAPAIARADVADMSRQVVIDTGLTAPFRIAVDPLSARMFWTNLSTGEIQSATLDGSDVQTIVGPVGRTRSGLTVDIQRQRIYWADQDQVWRANLDGSGAELVFSIGGTAFIQDLTLDPVGGYVYASDFSGMGQGQLLRATLDGEDLTVLRDGIEDGPVGLAVDSAGGRVYWTTFDIFDGTGSVNWTSLDGATWDTLWTGDDNFDDLVIDAEHGMLYWTAIDVLSNTGNIQRMAFDGSAHEVFSYDGRIPAGIAWVPEPSAAVLLLASGLVLLRRRTSTH